MNALRYARKAAPMKTLLLLRHGKATRDTSTLADHERPLKKKGVREAQAVGQRLRADGLLPELVLSSSAERARATAELVIQAAELELQAELLNQLYLAEPPAYLEALRSHAATADSVLVVGHNPGLEALVYGLTGEEHVLDTGALVECELPIESFAELVPSELAKRRGRVRQVFQPRVE